MISKVHAGHWEMELLRPVVECLILGMTLGEAKTVTEDAVTMFGRHL